MFGTVRTRCKIANPHGHQLREFITAAKDRVVLEFFLFASDFENTLAMNYMIRVINKGPFDKKRMPSALQFKIRIAAVRRRNVGVKEKRLVLGVKHVDGLFKCRREVNRFAGAVQMKNAIDEISHDFGLFKHLAEGRAIARMQILRPFKAFRNYDFNFFHIVQNS